MCTLQVVLRHKVQKFRGVRVSLKATWGFARLAENGWVLKSRTLGEGPPLLASGHQPDGDLVWGPVVAPRLGESGTLQRKVVGEGSEQSPDGIQNSRCGGKGRGVAQSLVSGAPHRAQGTVHPDFWEISFYSECRRESCKLEKTWQGRAPAGRTTGKAGVTHGGGKGALGKAVGGQRAAGGWASSRLSRVEAAQVGGIEEFPPGGGRVFLVRPGGACLGEPRAICSGWSFDPTGSAPGRGEKTQLLVPLTERSSLVGALPL